MIDSAPTARPETPRTPGGVNRTTLGIFVLATLACLGCDQFTKEVARVHLHGVGPASYVFGTVELWLVENPGAFLGLGSTLPKLVRELSLQVAIPITLVVLSIVFLRQPGLPLAHAVALALVVGGGAGNWIDRVTREGTVTDFVRVGIGPLHTGIFNLADVAILTGVGVLLLSSWHSRSHPPHGAGG